MRSIILGILVITGNLTFAQGVSEEWLTEASSNAITLSDETNFYIYGTDQLKLEREYEVIIKNKHAEDLQGVSIYYDQFRKVEKAELRVYNMQGVEIEKYKLNDFYDRALSISSVASDGRVKNLSTTNAKYPFKVKVSYSVTMKGSLFYPVWSPQEEPHQRIVSARFNIYDYTGKSTRYQLSNVAEPKVVNLEEGKQYSWSVENVEPFDYEYLNYNIDTYAPTVRTAPNSFVMDNYKGEMSSWNSFGQWIYQLNKDKNDLDPALLEELDVVVGKAQSNREKVAAVYDYLQKNTHYVSIQLGIGGWQPFNASTVHEKKYGDCKALSFYTKSLLENYGINSYYTLINAGKYAHSNTEEFPNAHFNHAILTVPMESDTVFLECTSQTKPFGYMGTFTSDRPALLIDESGGRFIKTRRYTAKESVQFTSAVVNLDKNGNADVSLDRKFTGLEIDNYGFRGLYHDNKKEYKEWFMDNHRWGNIQLQSFTLEDLNNKPVPAGGFHVDFTSSKEAISSGGRLFLQPGKYSSTYISKLDKKERKTPIQIRYGYSQVDTVVINPPQTYVIEKNLTEKSLDSKFGSYHRQIINNEGQLIYVREFLIKTGLYPPEEYENFREFIYQIKRWDRQKVVLVDKT